MYIEVKRKSNGKYEVVPNVQPSSGLDFNTTVYYNSSAEFTRDIDNRSIMEGEDKVFVCDGVTFVNDSTLNIPEGTLRQLTAQGSHILRRSCSSFS